MSEEMITAGDAAAMPETDNSSVSEPSVTDDVTSEGLEDVEEIADFLDEEGQPEEEQPEQAQPEAEQKDEQPINAPNSWSKQDIEIFNSLPRPAQEVIARREAQRDAFVNSKAQETAQARQEHDQLLQYAAQAVENALMQAEAAIEGEFNGIDFNALKQRDPMLYLKVEGMFEKRMNGVRDAFQRMQEMKQYHQQQAQQRQQALLQEQATGLTEKIAAIAGDGFDKNAWKKSAIDYLVKAGAPRDHISGVTHAYQAEILAKAMKYDEMQAKMAQAKSVVPEAPDVMRPGGADEGSAGNTRKAWKALQSNPDSTDALADLLERL